MQRAMITTARAKNLLLGALPTGEYLRLLSRSELVSFQLKDVVYQNNGPIEHVYFPENGVFSALVITQVGSAAEVGTIGREGMVGLPVFLGADRSPFEVICQVPAEARRMSAKTFRDEVRSDGRFYDLLQRYTQAQLILLSRSIACSNLHRVQKRMCRWLLMSHDRVGADDFPLTHEFLALMLGVRRTRVTVVASTLQKAGLIRYHRGRVTILDRRRLEDASCECYRIVKEAFDQLLIWPEKYLARPYA